MKKWKIQAKIILYKIKLLSLWHGIYFTVRIITKKNINVNILLK